MGTLWGNIPYHIHNSHWQYYTLLLYLSTEDNLPPHRWLPDQVLKQGKWQASVNTSVIKSDCDYNGGVPVSSNWPIRALHGNHGGSHLVFFEITFVHGQGLGSKSSWRCEDACYIQGRSIRWYSALWLLYSTTLHWPISQLLTKYLLVTNDSPWHRLLVSQMRSFWSWVLRLLQSSSFWHADPITANKKILI